MNTPQRSYVLDNCEHVPEASDVAGALVVSPDGETVFVSGYSNMGGSSLDYTTLAYDAGTGDDERRVTTAPDGETVVITGKSWGDGTSSDSHCRLLATPPPSVACEMVTFSGRFPASPGMQAS